MRPSSGRPSSERPERLLIVGLDCAAPALVFERYRGSLPTLSRLMREGSWGRLRSIVPPITVPAWAAMLSGRDAGEIGLYGFRRRRPGSYALEIADGRAMPHPRIWEVASEAGKEVAALYVPLSAPPRPVRGAMVGCFLGREGEPSTYPATLEAELRERFGPHRPDLSLEATEGGQRGSEEDKEALLEDLYEGGLHRFRVAHHLLTGGPGRPPPELLMMVEMGTDRLHHALWADIDPAHPRHDPSSPFGAEAEGYYAFLDAQIGRLIEAAGPKAAVMVVSDHGARAMLGGVRINEWLRREGWLVLRGGHPADGALRPDQVDWPRTRAWAAGGYYGRLFLNVRGRDPEGALEPEEVPAALGALREGLSGLSRLDGAPMPLVAHRPEELFREARGLPPDLMLFFDDLGYRALGTLCADPEAPIVTPDNDRGPDGCNHDWEGIFLLAGPGLPARGELSGLSIHDVGPTALSILGVPTPEGWLGADRSGL